MQADPSLLERDPAVVEEFAAVPWLLPPRSQALPWAGVHDFDALLPVMARRAGRWDKAVTILLFSKGYAVMSQNSSELPIFRVGGPAAAGEASQQRQPLACTAMREAFPTCPVLLPLPPLPPVYSLVKHGGVHNYIAVTWTRDDFEACQDMNLPCAYVENMLIEPLSECTGRG